MPCTQQCKPVSDMKLIWHRWNINSFSFDQTYDDVSEFKRSNCSYDLFWIELKFFYLISGLWNDPCCKFPHLQHTLHPTNMELTLSTQFDSMASGICLSDSGSMQHLELVCYLWSWCESENYVGTTIDATWRSLMSVQSLRNCNTERVVSCLNKLRLCWSDWKSCKTWSLTFCILKTSFFSCITRLHWVCILSIFQTKFWSRVL